MPSLSQFFASRRAKDCSSVAEQPESTEERSITASTTTTHYLATFPTSSSSPLLQSLSLPLTSSRIPSGSIYFRLTYPPSSSPTSFFLDCLPDPIGFLAHSANLIRFHLGCGSSGPSKWRHDSIQLILEDHDGLAHTCAGDIHVSLKWIGDIMRQVQDKRRDKESAIKEFKGVCEYLVSFCLISPTLVYLESKEELARSSDLSADIAVLHELVHAVQYDGYGTTPTWLVESVADYVRLEAHLGPPHWRSPGQGKAERGWEEGYDAGARFLSWLVGPKRTGEDLVNEGLTALDIGNTANRSAPSITVPRPPLPQPTKYPDQPYSSAPALTPPADRRRPGPWPDLVKELNGSLEHQKYSDKWWEGHTGVEGGLDGLWAAYLGFYR